MKKLDPRICPGLLLLCPEKLVVQDEVQDTLLQKRHREREEEQLNAQKTKKLKQVTLNQFYKHTNYQPPLVNTAPTMDFPEPRRITPEPVAWVMPEEFVPFPQLQITLGLYIPPTNTLTPAEASYLSKVSKLRGRMMAPSEEEKKYWQHRFETDAIHLLGSGLELPTDLENALILSANPDDAGVDFNMLDV